MPWHVETIPAVCISLRRQPNKWVKFQTRNKEALASLPLLRQFPAIDGREIDIKLDPRLGLQTRRDLLDKQRYRHEDIDSLGAVGCFLSHASIWQLFVDGHFEAPLLLVLEDDVEIPGSFVPQVNHLIENSQRLSQLQKSRDMWLLGASWIELVSPVPLESNLYRLGHRFWGTQAYILTQGFAEELLKHAFPVNCHVDAFIGIFARVFAYDVLWSSELNLHQFSWDILRQQQPLDLNTSNTLPLCGDIELGQSLHRKTEKVTSTISLPLLFFLITLVFLLQVGLMTYLL